MGAMKKARILWNYKWQWQTVVNWSRYFIYDVIRWINIWKAAVAVSHVWKNVLVLPPSAHRCILPPNSVPEHHFPKRSVKSTNSKEAEKHSPDSLFRFVVFYQCNTESVYYRIFAPKSFSQHTGWEGKCDTTQCDVNHCWKLVNRMSMSTQKWENREVKWHELHVLTHSISLQN